MAVSRAITAVDGLEVVPSPSAYLLSQVLMKRTGIYGVNLSYLGQKVANDAILSGKMI